MLRVQAHLNAARTQTVHEGREEGAPTPSVATLPPSEGENYGLFHICWCRQLLFFVYRAPKVTTLKAPTLAKIKILKLKRHRFRWKQSQCSIIHPGKQLQSHGLVPELINANKFRSGGRVPGSPLQDINFMLQISTSLPARGLLRGERTRLHPGIQIFIQVHIKYYDMYKI